MTFVYQDGIDAYCRRVIDMIHPDCIILHGSVARGTAHAHSDVDIIVVGGDLPEDFFKRLYLLNRLREGETPIEAVGYSRNEWEKMMDNLHLTTLEALEWGVPLYGETWFQKWRRQLNALKQQGLKRGERSWSAPPELRQSKVA